MKIGLSKILSHPLSMVILSMVILFLSLGVFATSCSPKGGGMRESINVKETKAFFGFAVDVTAKGKPRVTVITGDALPKPDTVAELNLDCALVCDGQLVGGYTPVGTGAGQCPRGTGSAHWSCRACPPIPRLIEDACTGRPFETCEPWVIPSACTLLSY